MTRVALATLCAFSTLLAHPVEGRGQEPAVAVPRLVRMDQGPATSTSISPAVFSLVIPGAGQHVLGQRRKWLYGAIEAAGWLFFIERRAAGAGARDVYRDYAWDHGRIQNGSRIDGDFPYYETLTHWTRSGDFDADPATSGVQPETDPSTYNGYAWQLASAIFLPPGGPPPSPSDPAYQNALAYYQDRAYGTDLLWDWSSTPQGQARLNELIADSDDRFREATTVLGAVIANHLISAVDAFVSNRGRDLPASVRVLPARGPAGPGWTATFSVPLGR